MIPAISLSSIHRIAYIYSNTALSAETIKELREFGLDISRVSSEREAKRIIDERTKIKENPNINENSRIQERSSAKETDDKNPKVDERLERIYRRLHNVAIRLGITISKTEKIETIFYKIQEKMSLLEKNHNNPNVNVISSEFDSIKYTYERITKSRSHLYRGIDILGETNKAILGIKNIKK